MTVGKDGLPLGFILGFIARVVLLRFCYWVLALSVIALAAVLGLYYWGKIVIELAACDF